MLVCPSACRLSLTGVNTPGMAMLARMAVDRLPPRKSYSVLSTMLEATQANGMGRSAKSMESCQPTVSLVNSCDRLLPLISPPDMLFALRAIVSGIDRM